MEKVTRILAPTDLSQLSRAGVRKALEIALSQDSEVIVYHVVGPEEKAAHVTGLDSSPADPPDSRSDQDLEEHHKMLLAKFVWQHFADIIPRGKMVQEVEVGVPHKKILEKAATAGVDLVVMSTHGRTGLARVFLGSITEKVVRHAKCRVLSVHPRGETKEEPKSY